MNIPGTTIPSQCSWCRRKGELYSPAGRHSWVCQRCGSEHIAIGAPEVERVIVVRAAPPPGRTLERYEIVRGAEPQQLDDEVEVYRYVLRIYPYHPGPKYAPKRAPYRRMAYDARRREVITWGWCADPEQVARLAVAHERPAAG